jgi:hypothetical protein
VDLKSFLLAPFSRPAADPSRWQLPCWAIALLYLILLNLPLALVSRGMHLLPHGYINLEFLLIGAAAVLLPRAVVFLLLLFESLANFAYAICYTYQFSLGNLLSSLRYLFILPGARVFAVLGLFAAVLLLCAFVAMVRPLPGQRLRTAILLLVVTGLLLPIDILDGQNPYFRKDMARVSFRLTRSPAFTLAVRDALDRRVANQSSHANHASMDSASSHAVSFLEAAGNHAHEPNVVLIVVESWGLAQNTQLAQALTATYNDPRITQKYTVTQGVAPFSGLTVPGEARELCHSNTGFGIMTLSPQQATQCLPAWFHARGYQNLAIHGYIGQMFSRTEWYPSIGFDRVWFGPDLQKDGLPVCPGAFPGVCDASIAQWMQSSLLAPDQGKPKFIYWMTLNSHLPVLINKNLASDDFCHAQPALNSSDALCSWFHLVQTVHQSVAQMALAPGARPTVFVLVGDHAPPFSDPDLVRDFSTTQVPYVMLAPKSLTGKP